MLRVTERRAKSRSCYKAELHRRRALPGFVLVIAVTLLALAGDAAAEPWRPIAQPCVSWKGSDGACTVARASEGLWQVVVAPGGTHAYAIAREARSILTFDRNPATGALTQRSGAAGCLSESEAGCDHAQVLGLLYGMTMSPDGRNLYTVAGIPRSGGGFDGIVAAFTREPSTGVIKPVLEPKGCFTVDGSYGGEPNRCTPTRGLGDVLYAITMDPDGRFVYAGAGSIVTFIRNASTGELTQLEEAAGCITRVVTANCVVSRTIGVSRQMSISPDGRSMYAVGREAGTVTILDRDPARGTLRQKDNATGCIGNSAGCTPDGRLAQPQAALVSRDGRHVYVSIRDGILVYRRYANGSLAFQSCITDYAGDGCANGRNLRVSTYSAMSPDGQTLVASSDSAFGISIFERDANGNLTQSPGRDGCVTRNGAALMVGGEVPGQCLVHPAISPNAQITFVDNSNFIVSTHRADAVIPFKRDFYPRCADLSYTVAKNLGAILPLACSDRNGDPLTFEITQLPSGALGAVDQTNAQIFYSPFLNHIGADAFRYRARAGELVSGEATVHVTVIEPEPPSPPVAAPKPTTVAAGFKLSWAPPTATRTRLTRLSLSKLPSGATIEISCHGGKPKCKLKSRKPLRTKSTSLNLLTRDPFNRKGARTFRPGQVLKVRIAAPGLHTKVIRLKFRKRRGPGDTEYCIPLGTKRLQKTC
jgi:6-phosphogluconolactonase (cycloisomerase 2 family)